MFNQMSKREQYLALAALVVLVSMGYWIFRWRGQQEKIEISASQAAKTDLNAAKARKELAKISRDADARVNLQQLTKKLKQMETQIVEESVRVKSLRRTFVENGDAEALQELKLQIADLAEKSKIHLRSVTPITNTVRRKKRSSRVNSTSRFARGESLPEGFVPPGSRRKKKAKSSAQTPIVKKVLDEEMLADVYQNGRQTLIFDSTFHGLRDFIAGLKHLDHSVTIVKFDVKIKPKSQNSQFSYPLSTTLLLTF